MEAVPQRRLDDYVTELVNDYGERVGSEDDQTVRVQGNAICSLVFTGHEDWRISVGPFEAGRLRTDGGEFSRSSGGMAYEHPSQHSRTARPLDRTVAYVALFNLRAFLENPQHEE